MRHKCVNHFKHLKINYEKITLILMAFAASTIAFAQNRQVDEFFKNMKARKVIPAL